MKTRTWIVAVAALAAGLVAGATNAAPRIKPENVQVVSQIPAGMVLGERLEISFQAFGNRPVEEVGAKQLRHEAARKGAGVVFFATVVEREQTSVSPELQPGGTSSGTLSSSGGKFGGSPAQSLHAPMLRRQMPAPRHGVVVGYLLVPAAKPTAPAPAI